MPRSFHRSSQLFRIPENADVIEEDDEECGEGPPNVTQPEACCPLVWVAILRETCVLVDIGEEEVPDVVIETAQGLLWETSSTSIAEKQVGWVEYCCDERSGGADMVWKGLRYNQAPWSFACVYNAQQISLTQCRRWIMDQVRWTSSMRGADPLWLNGGYHACQTLFAPLLQERLQQPGVAYGTVGSRGASYEQRDEVLDLESPPQSPLENLPIDHFGGEALKPVPGDDELLLKKDDGSQTWEESERGVALQDQSVTNTSPPRQTLNRAPNLGYPVSTHVPTLSSPYKEQSTEELVERLAQKQAELDRQRQERELRTSPVEGSLKISVLSDDCDQQHDSFHQMMIRMTMDSQGNDIDSGSLTSATAEDEEFGGRLMEDEPRDDIKPCNCWFMPSLPRCKGVAISP